MKPDSPRETYGGISVKEYYSPITPNGACAEDANALCPLTLEPSGFSDDEDDGDDGGDERNEEYEKSEKDSSDEDSDTEGREDFDYENENDREDREDREDKEGNEDMIGEENAVYGDIPNLDKVIQNAMNNQVFEPVKKYVPPVVTVRFSNEKDYPYEWLSPFYITHIRVNGEYYPSVGHYVVAKLATPSQFRNYPIREWIQKKKGRGEYTSPKDFYPIEECIENLQKRIQEMYNLLYIRYASRAIEIKFLQYPYRQILFETGNQQLIYNDNDGKNAVAGSEMVKLLTAYRSRIHDVVKVIPLENPPYNNENLALYDYIRERTRELLRSTILFARYRMSPRYNTIINPIPVISFNDAKFAIQQLYLSCRDINYNEVVNKPPDRYLTDFETDLTELLKLYFPERTMYNINNVDVLNAIRMKKEGHSEDKMDDKIFVNVAEIVKFVWIHIVQTYHFLIDGISNDQDVLRQKIKNLRTNIFKLNLGTRKEVAKNACINIISQLHTYFPHQTQLDNSEINFLQDFLYPLESTRQNTSDPIEESETYNSYPNLIGDVSNIFDNNEQDIKMLKKLARVLDDITTVSLEDKILYNKLTIRLKFFASS